MTIGKKIIGGYLIVLAILTIVCAGSRSTRSNDRRSLRRVSRFEDPGHYRRHRVRTGGEGPEAQYRGALIYPQQRIRLVNDPRESHRQFDALVEKLRSALPLGDGEPKSQCRV